VNQVFSVSLDQLPALVDYYADFSVPSDKDHILYLFQSPDLTVTVFRSLKVMLQGKDAWDEYMMWAEIFNFPLEEKKPEINPLPKVTSASSMTADNKRTIGSDEVGTGDFYGPVVVAAALAGPDDISFLKSLGVRDSKQMSDENIREIGIKLIKALPSVILTVDNEKYNNLVREGYNLNKIKAYLHNHAIRKLTAKCQGEFDQVVIDEFCPKEAYFSYLEGQPVYRDILFRQKAESAYIAVAAASVLARYTFLTEMDKLNKEVGLILPFGASAAVDLLGKRIALENGFDIFQKIAKTNFKNMDKIRNMMK